MKETGETSEFLQRLLDERVFDDYESTSETTTSESDGVSISEAVQVLKDLRDVARDVRKVAASLRRLEGDTLTRKDLIDLVWASNSRLKKGTVTSVFDAIDQMRRDAKKPGAQARIVERMIYDISGETKADVQKVLSALRDRLGDIVEREIE